MTRKVHVHIDELILRGFPGMQREQVAGEMRTALEGVIRAQGVPAMRGDTHIGELKTAPLSLPATCSSPELTTQVARATWSALGSRK